MHKTFPPPTSAADKARASMNGRNSSPPSFFPSHPEHSQSHRDQIQKHRRHCCPDSDASAAFQAKRGNPLETIAEALWLENLNHASRFS